MRVAPSEKKDSAPTSNEIEGNRTYKLQAIDKRHQIKQLGGINIQSEILNKEKAVDWTSTGRLREITNIL